MLNNNVVIFLGNDTNLLLYCFFGWWVGLILVQMQGPEPLRWSNRLLFKKQIHEAHQDPSWKTVAFGVLPFLSGHLYYCFCPFCKHVHTVTSTGFKAPHLLHPQLWNAHLKALLTQRPEHQQMREEGQRKAYGEGKETFYESCVSPTSIYSQALTRVGF